MAHFDLIDCNPVALEVISTIREPVYPEPQLLTGKGVRTKEGSKGPDDEHNRRKGTRELNQELSKYYQLPGKKAVWGSPELLLKGKHWRHRSSS